MVPVPGQNRHEAVAYQGSQDSEQGHGRLYQGSRARQQFYDRQLARISPELFRILTMPAFFWPEAATYQSLAALLRFPASGNLVEC